MNSGMDDLVCQELLNTDNRNCTGFDLYKNCSEEVRNSYCVNGGICDAELEILKGITIGLTVIISLIGNICTILLLSRFKVHKVPDVLVVGLALTDLGSTVIPVAMSLYAYFASINYTQGCILCDFFGTMAQFTRYSSAIIVTLVALERYYAVNRPFVYRKYATPKRFVGIMILCWLIAFVFAVFPVLHNGTEIHTHDGFCLFDLKSYYAIAILLYAAVQYVIVFSCFVLVTKELIKVYRRRKKLKVQGEYNKKSRAHRRRDSELTFTRPNFSARISDLGKSIRKAAPIITEKFQLSVEAQFARMLFAVVALFYITWTTIVAMIILAQSKKTPLSESQEEILFWGIRISVVSTAVNPFLYGILARQYRLAYAYVLRLWLSKCFYCISPPLKDVFAAARNAGGDAHATRRSSYQRSDSSVNNHFKKTNVLLTHTSQLPGGGVKLALPSRLSQIHEEMSLEPTESSINADFSTHVPTAGELSSSVHIPMQARDHNNSSTIDLELRGAASMHDLVDAGMVELGNTRNPASGINNPLAMITKVIGGEEVVVSPEGSVESDPHPEFAPTPRPPVFSNPVYELANGSPRTRGEIEAELAHRQNMLAASSTDDITLISKKVKKRVGKTLSGDPSLRLSDSGLLQDSPSTRGKSIKVTLNQVPLSGCFSYDALQERKRDGRSSLAREQQQQQQQQQQRELVSVATDIDTGMSVVVASQDNIDYQPPKQVQHRGSGGNVAGHRSSSNKASSVSPPRDIPSTAAKKKGFKVHNHSKSLDSPTPSTGSEVKQVHKMKGIFEPSTPPPPLPLAQEPAHLLHQEHKITVQHHHQTTPPAPLTTTGPVVVANGRRNSMENSDSGRESMVMDPDPMVVR